MRLGKIPVPSTFLCSQLRGHPSLSSPGLLHLLHPCHEPWKVIALNSQPRRDNGGFTLRFREEAANPNSAGSFPRERQQGITRRYPGRGAAPGAP